MDKALKISCAVISAVLLVGFFIISDAIRNRGKTDFVLVEGVAEKKVKSDIVEVKIAIKNKNEDLSKLYEKRMVDKQKVLDFLKKCGIEQGDIVSITAKTENLGEKEGDGWIATAISNQEKYFSSEDTILIKTNNFDNIEKMKNEIFQLAAEKIVISYKCNYKILDLQNIRAELLVEAAKKAEKNAEILLKSFGKKIKKIQNIDGSWSMNVMNETQNNSWEKDDNNSSLMKKVEQTVRAEFVYE